MTVADIIKLLENKLATLNGQKTTASIHGDMERVLGIEALINETQHTLEQLKTL